MKKQQLILASAGVILLALLFIFGNTIPPVSTDKPAEGAGNKEAAAAMNVLDVARKTLTPHQSEKITQLENSVVRGDVKEQKIVVYNQMGRYWRDSLERPEIGAYYFGEAAKLENSEKTLNFAARLMLDYLMAESDPGKLTWLATNAKALFEQSLKINPADDSVKVELGACYLFGNVSGMPMEGIQKIKEVADRDTTNMYAQLMLGLGDIRSQQYDKAVERLSTVVKNEPHNMQALFNLAETYERKGDKTNAIKYYRHLQNFINVPEAKQELENRINSLQ